MKLFHSFDTSFRKNKVKEYQNKYGVDNVLSFGKSRLYWIIKVVLPFLFLIVLSFFLLILFNEWMGGNFIIYAIIGIIIIDIFFMFPIMSKYINYKMGFIIITHESIIMYDQGGLFKKNILTLNSTAIKTINVERKSFLYSLFNNGDLVILSEAVSTDKDNRNYGRMILRWVAKPEKKRDKITKMLEIH